jgi:branched-subunit amino acid transport protein
MRIWGSILLVFVAVTLLKASGPMIVGSRRLPEPVMRVVQLLAPALLTGLVIVALLGHRWVAVNVTQLVGVAVAITLRLLGWPMLACAALGMAAAAVLRVMT